MKKCDQALADLRSARIDAWAATGHADPEDALSGDLRRDAARALGPPSSAERKAVSAVAAAHEGLVFKCVAGLIRGRPDLADDILQDGRIGLLRAIDRYDHRPGTKFSTFAYWAIQGHATTGVMDRGDTIRVPTLSHNQQRQIDAARDRYPDADQDEVAKITGLAPETIRRIDSCVSRDIVNDYSQITTDDDADHRLDLARASAIVESTLAKSSDRDSAIFRRLVFGDAAFKVVGEEFKLTTERIRQIYAAKVVAMCRAV